MRTTSEHVPKVPQRHTNATSNLPPTSPLALVVIAISILLALTTSQVAQLLQMPRRTARGANPSASTSDEPPSTTTALPERVSWPSTFTDGLPLPKIVVFDLDYTLWPFWVDTHVTPPLKAQEGGLKVKDRYNEAFGFYSDVGGILEALKTKGITIGIASRTHAPELGREMLTLLKVPASPSSLPSFSSRRAIDFFEPKMMQIYPGNKTTHFERIHRDSGIEYEDMLFFDDESRNKNVEVLGVVMCLVRDGVSRDEVDRGVRSWRKRNKKVADGDA